MIITFKKSITRYKMDLVNTKDILRSSPRLANLGGEYFAKFLMYVLRFNKLNKIYGKASKKEGIEFIDEVIRILDIKFEFDETELHRIPKTGPIIHCVKPPIWWA